MNCKKLKATITEKTCIAISKENRALLDDIERLKMALAWYASVNNWRSMAVHSDKGDNARKTLNYGQSEF